MFMLVTCLFFVYYVLIFCFFLAIIYYSKKSSKKISVLATRSSPRLAKQRSADEGTSVIDVDASSHIPSPTRVEGHSNVVATPDVVDAPVVNVEEVISGGETCGNVGASEDVV